MRQNKKNKGFTLVELLIVVAIIGILAAVLTPQFLNARKTAADKAAEAYAHNVYTAVQAHIAETGETTAFSAVSTCSDFNLINGNNYKVPEPGSSLKLADTNPCRISAGATAVQVKYSGGHTGTTNAAPNGTITVGDTSVTFPN